MIMTMITLIILVKTLIVYYNHINDEITLMMTTMNDDNTNDHNDVDHD